MINGYLKYLLLYHHYRRDNINNFGLQCCIFVEADNLGKEVHINRINQTFLEALLFFFAQSSFKYRS